MYHRANAEQQMATSVEYEDNYEYIVFTEFRAHLRVASKRRSDTTSANSCTVKRHGGRLGLRQQLGSGRTKVASGALENLNVVLPDLYSHVIACKILHHIAHTPSFARLVKKLSVHAYLVHAGEGIFELFALKEALLDRCPLPNAAVLDALAQSSGNILREIFLPSSDVIRMGLVKFKRLQTLILHHPYNPDHIFDLPEDSEARGLLFGHTGLLTLEQTAVLANFLRGKKTLRMLDLADNDISMEEGAEILLGEILRELPPLEVLGFNAHHAFLPDDVDIVAFLGDHLPPHLSALFLNFTLDDEDMSSLGFIDIFRQLTSLRYLHIIDILGTVDLKQQLLEDHPDILQLVGYNSFLR
ncbi:hypothetical protein L226DRAFT_587224 [Lentinus tigrinus ALCF2SS1-7]|uniref:RNI-like protein n=1 Tax=Lentinus tigrinus ALCF2SS1-6 TaxID=1328759 RepID=A0A5C2RNQ1_9APHY|nr:hypothetical protein L227DRAFT_643893 [Lentinus tigrinus ALCF2SS1-6]RPD72701.1 hypothetical protein L226DRAFT_587224 [Lentinus tigrinus ALCF2SS1-7]